MMINFIRIIMIMMIVMTWPTMDNKLATVVSLFEASQVARSANILQSKFS